MIKNSSEKNIIFVANEKKLLFFFTNNKWIQTLNKIINNENFESYFILDKNEDLDNRITEIDLKFDKKAVLENIYNQIIKNKPQIIFTDIEFSEYLFQLKPFFKNIAFVLFIENYFHICPTPKEMNSCDKNCKSCNFYINNYSEQENRKEILQESDYIWSLSKDISKTIYQFIGKKTNIVLDLNTISNEKISQEKFNNFIDNIIKDLNSQKNYSNSLNIRWEGSQFIHHSLAIVNRELEIELLKNPKLNLSIIPFEKHLFTEKDLPKLKILADNFYKKLDNLDFTIKHKWPPDFNSPNEGKFIIIQPWEASSMPKEWLKPFSKDIDEIWVPSNFNRNTYINSGIPKEKVYVIPNGINIIKTPKPLKLNTNKSFKFLFIGATVNRKGIDILLNAYIQEFKKNDDVCLIIKDIGLKNVYSNTYKDEIERLLTIDDIPEILYLNESFSEEEIAGLYSSCNVYVQPYRGEGFGLPIAEAMGYGLPVIVTNSGSALDFCLPEFSYLLDYEMKKSDDNYYVDIETIDTISYPEVKHENLKYWMRYVFEHEEEAINKGKQGEKYISENFTWEYSAKLIYERLLDLKDKPTLRENHDYYFNEYQKKALNLFNKENYSEALKYFLYCNEIKEKDANNLYYIGLSNFSKNNYSEALKYFTESCKYNLKEKEVYKYMSLSLKELGDNKTSEILMMKYNNET